MGANIGVDVQVNAVNNVSANAVIFATALNNFVQKFSTANNVFGDACLKTVGAAGGVAPLDAARKVPVGNLPHGVSDGICGLDHGVKVAAWNLPIGTADGIAGLDAGSKVPTGNLPGIVLKKWESEELALATWHDLAHTLGAAPLLAQVFLRCKQAEFGFLVGENILADAFVSASAQPANENYLANFYPAYQLGWVDNGNLRFQCPPVARRENLVGNPGIPEAPTSLLLCSGGRRDIHRQYTRWLTPSRWRCVVRAFAAA